MVLVVGHDPSMFSPSPNHRPSPHPVMAQQSHAGYFGYYPQQPGHHPHHQYPPSDFNCNFQHFMTPGQFDGLQGSGWANHHSMYVHHASASSASSCQQRSPAGYDEWTIPPHAVVHHPVAGSPLPQPSVTGLPLSHQPPHTPSPCTTTAPSSVPNNGPVSPSYPNSVYFKNESDMCADPESHGSSAGADSYLPLGQDNSSGEGSATSLNETGGALSQPRPQPARSPFEWMKKSSYQSQSNSDAAYLDIATAPTKEGKTRTKDKYRVVYSDQQRLELEKEFHYSRYITIRRKAELAAMLGLSERQVKIWFQNRRAKERKQMKKRDELMQKEKMESYAPHSHAGTMHVHIPPHQMTPSKSHLMMDLMDIKPPLLMD